MQSTYYSSVFILSSSSHPKSRAGSHFNTETTSSRAKKCSRNIRTTQIVAVWPKFAWQPSHSAQSSHALSSWQRSLVPLHVTKCTSTNNSWKPSLCVGSYTVLTCLDTYFSYNRVLLYTENKSTASYSIITTPLPPHHHQLFEEKDSFTFQSDTFTLCMWPVTINLSRH